MLLRQNNRTRGQKQTKRKKMAWSIQPLALRHYSKKLTVAERPRVKASHFTHASDTSRRVLRGKCVFVIYIQYNFA